MNLKIIVTLVLITAVFQLFAQNTKDYSIIYLNDGSTVKGYDLKHKTSTFNPSGYIKAKDKLSSKKIKINTEIIDSIINFNYLDKDDLLLLKKELNKMAKKNKQVNFDSIKKEIDAEIKDIGKGKSIESKSKVIFLNIKGIYKYTQVLVEGKLNLYEITIFPQNTLQVFRHYYVQRINETKPFLIAKDEKMKSKEFIKKATEYFKSCPKLSDKILNKEFEIKHIIKIVEFYNKNCD